MVFAFYVCTCAIGAGPEGAVCEPPSSYFKSPPAVENKLLPPASLLKAERKARKRRGREGASTQMTPASKASLSLPETGLRLPLNYSGLPDGWATSPRHSWQPNHNRIAPSQGPPSPVLLWSHFLCGCEHHRSVGLEAWLSFQLSSLTLGCVGDPGQVDENLARSQLSTNTVPSVREAGTCAQTWAPLGSHGSSM
jgi:hypothetical protein